MAALPDDTTPNSLSTEIDPSWVRNGLLTWAHLYDPLFRWDTGSFAERWTKWQISLHNLIGQRGDDKVRDFLGDILCHATWQRSLALLNFRRVDDRIGNLGDLDLMSSFLETYFEGELNRCFDLRDDPNETECVLPPFGGQVAIVSVAKFDSPPWSNLGRMPHGWSVPVFDARPGRTTFHPFLVESTGWPEDLGECRSRFINRQYIGANEFSLPNFFDSNLDFEFREHGVGRLAIVLRPVAQVHLGPENLLRDLVAAIFLSMSETKNSSGIATSIPRPPSTGVINSETLLNVRHWLYGWLDEVKQVYPELAQEQIRSTYSTIQKAIPRLVDLRKPVPKDSSPKFGLDSRTDRERLTPDRSAMAVAMLTLDPRPSMQQIADTIGVKRQDLYEKAEFENLRKARAALKRKKALLVPRGTMTADGDIEATAFEDD